MSECMRKLVLNNDSMTAGKAWQTPFGMYAPVMDGAPVASCATHAVVVQLPLEGMLQGEGISAVLKRPAGMHPEWLTQQHGRNLFVSFAEVCPSEVLSLRRILTSGMACCGAARHFAEGRPMSAKTCSRGYDKACEPAPESQAFQAVLAGRSLCRPGE